jgi:opacity protein-like surface antigen
MKKLTLTTLAAATLFSSLALANPLEGHRVGLGFSDTAISDWERDVSIGWGSGIRLEYGYEFNRIVGVNLSYSENNDSVKVDNSRYDINGSTFQLDADIGYKFMLDGFSIKPYGIIGLARHDETHKIKLGDSHQGKASWNDTSLVAGLGARAEFGSHIYTDVRFDIAAYDDADIDQFSWTIGYKF